MRLSRPSHDLQTIHRARQALPYGYITKPFSSETIVAGIEVALYHHAVIREREHGTLEHLLVMPLTAFEIAMAKVWANALVILFATGMSLFLVVEAVRQKKMTVDVGGKMGTHEVGDWLANAVR